MNDLFSLSTDITINFSQKQVREILTEAINQRGYKVVGDISFRLEEESFGYGPGETYRTVFRGATAKVIPGNSPRD